MRFLAASLLMAFLAVSGGCSTSSPSNADAGASGVVPPDLRDVEREGEGLVATTFGDFPTRTPDWTRAGEVLSLLKQVWGRAKTATPNLPSAQVQAIDSAIASLDQAIAAQDQESAVYASNAIGLAVPALFDFFHPDAPIGVVRMDAVFRQIGLDGHYNKLDGVNSDLSTLKSDWASTSGPVGVRAPTCHRVGGTATVAGEVEQSLSNLDAAAASSDFGTIEKESDNGALEIDTLELLFDCPPDNTTPSHGIGAKCTDNSTCDPGQVCDTANAGGKCAPDPQNAKIGVPCTTTIDCGSDARSACNNAAGDGYPGGYCFMEPCDDVQVCPPGATCVSLGGETPGCFKTCTVDADCRVSEGYVCQLFSTTPPTGFGPSDLACAFPCTRDADCHTPLRCVISSGKCSP
ncbi:MAG: hypothetical protein ACRELY_22330 [Polyangiaceae bacterium]